MGRSLTHVLVALAVLAALAAAAYGGLRLGGEGETPKQDAREAVSTTPDEPASEPETGGPEGLREAALSLVPPVASEQPTEEDLAEKDCTAGVVERPPPCIHFFFPTKGVTLAERKRAVKETAAANGWKRERGPNGFLYFSRGSYSARIGLSPDHPVGVGDRLPVLNEIMVFDLSRQPPAEPPPDPSGWTVEKRAFVAKANAICKRINREVEPLDMKRAKLDANVVRLADIWARGTDDIAALEPPPGDDAAVAKIVVEFRRFEKTLRILARVEGEMTLAAVVGMFEQGKRAGKTARAYGITGCSELA